MTEPILIGLAPALITGLIAAIANLAKAFGFDVSQEQVDALNALVLPLMLVLGAVGTWWARQRSTSLASPNIPQGTDVTVVTPEGQPNEHVTV